MIPIPFATRTYVNRSLPVSAQNLVNLYPEQQQQDAKNPVVLHRTPGKLLVATVGTGPIRGQVKMGGLDYVVSGNELYGGDRDGSYTLIGRVTGSPDLVSMSENGTDISIVTGISAYTYSLSDGLVEVSDTDFKNAFTNDYLDGFFIYDKAGTGEWFISNLLSGQIFDSTDNSTTYSNSDNVLAVKTINGQVYVFGERSIEVYYNSGAADFPFARINELTQEIGTASRYSIQEIDDVVYFLGNDLEIYRFYSGNLEALSDPAISNQINNLTKPTHCEAWSYKEGSHRFYCLNFPTDSVTLCYDIFTSTWHKRSYFTNGLHKQDRVRTHLYCYNKHLVGDRESGNIYELDDTVYTDNGGTIVWEAVSPPIHKDGELLFMSEALIEFEQGVGIETGQGSNPQVQLAISENAKTWTDLGFRSIGKIGEYDWASRWTRLGSFYTRVFKLSGSSPVKTVIIRMLGRIGSVAS